MRWASVTLESAAAALENAGFATRLIEPRVVLAECHVAIPGVDNLPARRLVFSGVWALAIDIGPDTIQCRSAYFSL